MKMPTEPLDTSTRRGALLALASLAILNMELDTLIIIIKDLDPTVMCDTLIDVIETLIEEDGDDECLCDLLVVLMNSLETRQDDDTCQEIISYMSTLDWTCPLDDDYHLRTEEDDVVEE